LLEKSLTCIDLSQDYSDITVVPVPELKILWKVGSMNETSVQNDLYHQNLVTVVIFDKVYNRVLTAGNDGFIVIHYDAGTGNG
jgi:hypothetical protein